MESIMPSVVMPINVTFRPIKEYTREMGKVLVVYSCTQTSNNPAWNFLYKDEYGRWIDSHGFALTYPYMGYFAEVGPIAQQIVALGDT